MPSLCAIDPGPELSAFIWLDDGKPGECGKIPNDQMLDAIRRTMSDAPIVIEQVASYGMPVGAEVFETVYWSGRFAEAAIQNGREVDRLPRNAVKMHLCYRTGGVTDSVIRQALIDRYGPGREKAVGVKKSPGPCYAIKDDIWQALALAVTYHDKKFAGQPVF